MTRIRVATAAVSCALLGLTCCASPPEEVWVRDPASPASLRIWLGGGSDAVPTVGRWIDLHAERTTGRWLRVRFDDLEPGSSWLRRPPPAEETGVEANVRWLVEPDGAAEFNLPTAVDPLTRKVRFTAPGTYTVSAQSHSWGGEPILSNRVTVTIQP